jgi:hypothetical protein
VDVPQMSKKQAEFFALIILICTVTAAFILIIDYQIKGAILEQATRLRKMIEDGQTTAAANGYRPGNNLANEPAYPADMVGSRDAGMETASPDKTSNGTPPPSRTRAAKPKGTTGPGIIPDSGK